jgi:hypothetical protein
MEDLSNPGGARLRSIRQWSENGFDELSVGVLVSMLGMYPLVVLKLARSPSYGMEIAPFLLLALILPFNFVTKRVRDKVIFPRTGYFVFRLSVPRKWMVVVFGGLSVAQAAALAYWGFRLQDFSRLAGPAMGVLFAACLLWGGIRYVMPQYVWLAGLSLLLGAATLLAGLKIEGAIWVMVGDGVAMALDGAFRMRCFLKTHPIVEADPIGDGRLA